MIPDLSARATLPELMDDPDCDEIKLLRTVRQFASINRWVSRYRTILKRWVLDDMQHDPAREYHLVDMGAGGCDIDVWLLKAARQRGLKLRITACDMDARILAQACSVYGHVQELKIKETDLLTDALDEPIDYVFANHFLHHLTSEEIIRLLQLWQPRVRRMLVFSDLLRSSAAYFGYSALSLFYPNSFARADGLISIRKGFLPNELSALADATTKAGFSIHPLPPGRLVLCIDGGLVDAA